MTDRALFQEINNSFDFLLNDHGVDFDEPDLETNSLELFHAKADALLTAHQVDIPDADDSVAALQPKLDLLIEDHGENYDDSDADPNSWETVNDKLETLTETHGQ